MIGTTDISLRVRLLAAVATTQCPITGHYVTMTEAGIVTGVNPIHTVTNNTTAITVVPTVPSGVGVLKNLQVVNQDTANINVIVEQYSLSTGVAREMSSTPLGVGQYLMIDAGGNHSVSAATLVSGGTVTQVQGNGTVNGLTLSGNVTTSGNLTLGGTLSGSAPSLTAGNVTNIPNLSGVITGNSTGTTTLTANGTNSAGVAAWVSDETGTGSLVFATSPNLTTPALGTPVSGDLTNCTSYPRKFLHVRDEKANNTNAGANSAGVNTRELNTVVVNTITGASLSSNQVSLPAGMYKVNFAAPCLGTVGVHRTYLYNVTDSVILIAGINSYGGTTVTCSESAGFGVFTISGTKTIELRHYIQASVAAYGLGGAVNSGDQEIYASSLFEKLI